MDLLEVLPILIFFSILTGILAGLLGIGGGLITVPLYQYTLLHLGLDLSLAMKIAISTTFLVMVFTASSSLFSHYRNGNIHFFSLKKIIIPLIIGVLIGAELGHILKGEILYIIFYSVVLLISLNMLLGKQKPLISTTPPNFVLRTVGLLIGSLSSLMGVGGGAISTPIFLYLNFNIRKAIGNSSIIGFCVSIPATLSYLFNSFYVETDIPYTFGYFHLGFFLITMPLSMLFAPIGVKINKHLPIPILKKIFAFFLLFLSIRAFFLY